MENKNTILFTAEKENNETIKEIISTVFKALEEKGYDPIAQLSGYLLSGDPSYITSYDNARSLIKHIERDDIVEELLREFLK